MLRGELRGRCVVAMTELDDFCLLKAGEIGSQHKECEWCFHLNPMLYSCFFSVQCVWDCLTIGSRLHTCNLIRCFYFKYRSELLAVIRITMKSWGWMGQRWRGDRKWAMWCCCLSVESQCMIPDESIWSQAAAVICFSAFRKDTRIITLKPTKQAAEWWSNSYVGCRLQCVLSICWTCDWMKQKRES